MATRCRKPRRKSPQAAAVDAILAERV